jgi:hypothetical protein
VSVRRFFIKQYRLLTASFSLLSNSVRWQDVTCYSSTYASSLQPPFLEKCVDLGKLLSVGVRDTGLNGWPIHLGIHLSTSLSRSTTHFITSKLSTSVAMSTGLLSLVRFVRPEWLAQLLMLGKSTNNNELNKCDCSYDDVK